MSRVRPAWNDPSTSCFYVQRPHAQFVDARSFVPLFRGEEHYAGWHHFPAPTYFLHTLGAKAGSHPDSKRAEAYLPSHPYTNDEEPRTWTPNMRTQTRSRVPYHQRDQRYFRIEHKAECNFPVLAISIEIPSVSSRTTLELAATRFHPHSENKLLVRTSTASRQLRPRIFLPVRSRLLPMSPA